MQKWPLSGLSSPVPSSLSSAIQLFCSDRTKRFPCSFVHFLFNRLIQREGTDNRRKTPRNEQQFFRFLIEETKGSENRRLGSENRRRTKNNSIVVEYFMPSPFPPFLPLGKRKKEGRNKQQILGGATIQSHYLHPPSPLFFLFFGSLHTEEKNVCLRTQISLQFPPCSLCSLSLTLSNSL